MQLSPFSAGSYTALDFPDGCQWTINLGNDAQVSIDYNDGTEHTVTAKNGTIILHLQSSTLLTTTPHIANQGQTVFAKGYVGWIGSPDKVTSEGDRFSINGNVSFTIDSVDGTTALLSNLTYSGSAMIPAASTATWNELDIPWYTILTSPYHILLVALMTVSIIVWYGLKKLRSNITAIL